MADEVVNTNKKFISQFTGDQYDEAIGKVINKQFPTVQEMNQAIEEAIQQAILASWEASY